jgi:hypothetical protein
MIEHNVKIGKLDYCQICGSRNLFEAIDLGFQPPCGTLLTTETLRDPETYYPLRLMICSECGDGQLDYVVGSRICFPEDYPYRPGISIPLREHLERLAEDIISKNKLKPGSLVVDVGSNDGTLLSFFKKKGMNALGVEPTNMAKVANRDGIRTIQEFFNKSVAENIVKKYGKAKIITFTNVFAHMATLGEVMDGLSILLDEGGAVVSESQYLLDVFEGNQFDEIYHDHIRIYSLKSLVNLFPYYGMEVFDAKRVSTREGSIEVSAGWKGKHTITPEVKKLLKIEEDVGLFDPQGWKKFRQRVVEQKRKFLDLVQKVKKQGLKLVADSCPTRGVVLLNYYGLDLPYVAQLPGTEKVGKYIPGTHTPIVSNDLILKDEPDYILILAWHYSDYIIKNWRAKGVKAKFIVPLPEFQIV